MNEIRVHTNVRFMKKFKRYEPTVQDHSAMIQAKMCKRKYFYRIVLGFVERGTPQYFGFGSCYHKFREVLEREYMANPSNDEQVQLGMFGKALHAARTLWKDKKMHDPIVGDRWDFLTEGRLIESCSVAYKHWQKEKQHGRIQVIAVEQNFIVPLPNGIHIGGKADQIVRWNGKVWGRDFKTSSKEQNKYFERTLDPNDQFTRYTYGEQQLCGEPVQGQMVEVLYNAKGTKSDPKKGPTIHPHLATRSQSQLARWEHEQMVYDKLLQVCRDEDTWPMEERSCPFCEYHSVCKASSEASQMAKLEAEFVVSPWNFLTRDVDDE